MWLLAIRLILRRLWSRISFALGLRMCVRVMRYERTAGAEASTRGRILNCSLGD